MSNWKDKFSAVTSAIKASANEVADKVADTSKEMVAAGTEQFTSLAERTADYWNELDWSELTSVERHRERIDRYYTLSSDKVTGYYKSALDVDKTTEQIIIEIQQKLPVPVQTFDEIFEQCKNEALRKAVAAFCLAPVVQGLDRNAEDRYANISQTYQEFKAQNILHDHPNFATMNNERYGAKNGWTLLANGYQRDNPLDPFNADIEHRISKNEIFDDWLIRAGTTDDEYIALINSQENLSFADASVNRSKGARDLMEYLDGWTPDPNDPDLLHKSINGTDKTVRRSDCEQAYEEASERIAQARLEALTTIGVEVTSAAAVMATQQVVGLIVVETIDIFVDETKDLVATGKLFSNDGLLADLKARQERISARLAERFAEKQIWERARTAGVEGALAGALGAIPQILLSILTKMPALVLSIVRECTLSLVRCVRVLMAPGDDKFDGIKIILLGTVSAVMSVYLAHMIGKAIRAVPLLSAFDREVALVLSSVIVVAIPLVAIYGFERNKSKFTFRLTPATR